MKNTNYFHHQQNETPHYKIPNEKVHSIVIDLLNEHYNIATHDESHFIIKGPMLTEKDYELLLEQNKLIFKRNDYHTIAREPYGDGKKIDIYLPNNLLLRDFTLSVKSGVGRVSDIDSDQINLFTISGEITINNIESSVFFLETKSGDVTLTNLNSSNATIKTMTADVELSNINIKNALNCESHEGDIDIEEGFVQELFFKTESGDFDGKEFYPNTLSYESIDGDLNIKNKKTEHDIIIKSKQSIDGEIKIKS